MAVQTRIKLRRATAAVWANVNPVLALGEPGFEVDTNKLKIGNGNDAWATLDYASGGASVFVGTTAPVDPEPNSLWWNSETGGLYILYGTTWVDASPAVAGPQGPQGIQGPAGPQGEPGAPADSSALIPNSIIDAAGDLIVGSAADTPARLALGTNGQVLTSNGTTATWATPATGGMALLSTTTLSGASTTISNISQSYKALYIVGDGIYNATAGQSIKILPNSVDNAILTGTSTTAVIYDYGRMGTGGWASGSQRGNFAMQIDNYASTTANKAISIYGSQANGADTAFNQGGAVTINAAITAIQFANGSGGNFGGGTIKIYGVN